MNCILEGPEAVGKTTLAKKLMSKYDMSYEHFGSCDLDTHMNALLKDNVVYDRFHIGELVYPEIYGRVSKFNNGIDDAFTIMKRIVDNNDILIIFIASDTEVLKERLRERKEFNYIDEIDLQNSLFVKYAYVFSAWEYKNFYVVDVSEKDAYTKLDSWIDSHMNKTTVNLAYKKVCKDLVEKGHVMETRNIRGNTRELCNYMFTIDDISDPVISLKTGKCSLEYLAGETLWYWSSRNDLNFISKFGSLWNKLTDDGEHCNSAYGYILQKKHGFNQIEKVIELLEKDRYSRRAVLNINVPNENVIDTKDEMCTICLIYQIRNERLNCTCVMRSNDIKYGTRNDLGYFLFLQKYIADRLGVGYGTYTHFAASIHVYDRDYDYVRAVAYGNNDTEEEILDLDALLQNSDYFINYIDTEWKNKEDFSKLLREKGVIRFR